MNPLTVLIIWYLIGVTTGILGPKIKNKVLTLGDLFLAFTIFGIIGPIILAVIILESINWDKKIW